MLDVVQNIVWGIAITASIGPVTIETIRRGLTYGFISAFSLNFGAILVDGIYLCIIFFGLSSFASNIYFKSILGITGVLFLMYLGLSDVKSFFSREKVDFSPNKKSSKYSFLTGILINITNPLTPVAWVSFYGVFAATSKYRPNDIHMLFDISWILVGALIVGLFLSITSRASKRLVKERALKYVSLMAGILLILISLYLAYKTALLFI